MLSLGALVALSGQRCRWPDRAPSAPKRLVDEGTNAALETTLSYEQKTLIALYAADDGQEVVVAFLEKRAAAFRGQ